MTENEIRLTDVLGLVNESSVPPPRVQEGKNSKYLFDFRRYDQFIHAMNISPSHG